MAVVSHIQLTSLSGGRGWGLSCLTEEETEEGSEPGHLACSWQVKPAHARGPDFSGRRRGTWQGWQEGLPAGCIPGCCPGGGQAGCGGRLPHHKPPFMMLNKAPSEPSLGCANMHIWAAGLSRAAELPHSWPAAPDLLDKGSFGPVGAPGELGALESRAPTQPSIGGSPLWLPPLIFIRTGTLRLTAFPAEGMPFPSP